MEKFKLEYIWLDGYEPVPNLRGKTKVVAFDRFPTLEELPLWGFDGSSTKQADGSDSDCVLKPVALFPDPARTNGVLVMCEVLLPDGTPHPSNSRAAIPDDPGHVVRLRAGVLLLLGRRSARLPGRRRLPGAAGRVLHRRRPQERRLARAPARRGASRPLPRRRDQPRGHQRRGGEGPVGVPDLRQGLEARRRRDVGRPLPAAAPLRALRRRRQLALQAARRRRRLERLGHARELLQPDDARGRRQGVLRGADGRVRAVHAGAHRGLRARQPPAPDRPPRDAVDRHVQLGHRRSRRLDPRAAQLRRERLARVPRGSPAELAGRPVPHRRPHHRDDRDGRRVGSRGDRSRSRWPRPARRARE